MEKPTKILINSSNMNTVKRREKAQRVARDMYLILNSNLFEKLILEMPDKWRLGESSKYKNLPTAQIHKMILEGDEEWQNSGKDYVFELHVDDYTKWYSKVVGYIIPFKKPIWVNTKFYDSMSDKRVGSNFLHEGGHHIGFRHSGPDFKKSFSYYLNLVYETCYDHFFVEKKPDIDGEVINLPSPKPQEYKIVCKRMWWSLWLYKKCYRIYDY